MQPVAASAPPPVPAVSMTAPVFSAGSVIGKSFSVWFANFVPFSIVTLAVYVPVFVLAALAPVDGGPGWNGMDRLFAGRFEDTGQAALFEVVLPVRTDADVTALVFDPARGSYALSFTRFNLFAITGMARK